MKNYNSDKLANKKAYISLGFICWIFIAYCGEELCKMSTVENKTVIDYTELHSKSTQA